MARRSSKKTTSIKVNFKGVESRRTPAEGDYLCTVLEAKQEESSKGNDQIVIISEIAEGEYKGAKLYLYCPLSETSLWKLHAFLTALGEEVPEDEMEIDLEELAGKEFMGVVGHETYQGKKNARLMDFDVASAYEGGEGDKKSKKDKKKKDKGGDEEKSDKKSKKGDKEDAGDKKSSKKDKSEKGGKDKDDGKKSKDKGKDKKAKKLDADEVRELDEKGLKKLIKEHDLDVDLADYKSDKKKAAAVISALEDADLID